ncbi:tripeptidyl-peptidase II Tpp2, variant 2 [Balamuthia mandrillaris]
MEDTATAFSVTAGKGGESSPGFPLHGLLPKRETQVGAFLSKYPAYDGKDVVVGIFDTGVDAGAEGLRRCPDGSTKVIDMVDCTGAGDVNTSTVRYVQEGVLLGLSGRRLKVPVEDSAWHNPTGQFRVGMKRAYELFPEGLVSRLKKERKDEFEKQHKQLVANLQRQIEACDRSAPSALVAAHLTNEKSKGQLQPSNSPVSEPDRKQMKKELEARIQALNELWKSYDDPGPIYDCIVFHDGTHWRAAVDVRQDGDLSQADVLTDYYIEHQLSNFGAQASMNYAVNIYEEGNVLSIVVVSGSHGTHVAGIVGAYYPDNPELNGIAPSAKIVSLQIGDNRLAAMETGTAMIRGLSAALRSKCDIINMSFGEATSVPNGGRFIEIATQLVNEHNVLFISSAGNNGPALSTLGAPGGTASAILGVGAFVHPSMMGALYSMREDVSEQMYTWSSRGPTPDGFMGVNISAPGGAVSPVPSFTLKRNQLMNGTSMSSPNCCGGVALILSALKAEGTFYTPYLIYKALENTAKPIEGGDRFALGQGLIQVLSSYEWLARYPTLLGDSLATSFYYEVDLPLRDNSRGLYLRGLEETRGFYEGKIRVQVVWPHKHDWQATNRARLAFDQRLELRYTQHWLSGPSHIQLSNGEKRFDVVVDYTGLPKGEAHFAEVQAFDVALLAAGPVFRFPITVIPPLQIPYSKQAIKTSSTFTKEPVDEGELQAYNTEETEDESEGFALHLHNLKFSSGFIFRKFVSVPMGATHAKVKIRTRNIDTKRLLVLHALQLLPEKAFCHTETEKYLWCHGPIIDEQVVTFKIVSGITLELCLAQFWSSLGDTVVDLMVEFYGLSSSLSACSPLTDLQQAVFDGKEKIMRVDVRSCLHREVLSPSVVLNTWQHPVLPSSHFIRLLPDIQRDTLPNGSAIYEMILSYNFKLTTGAEVCPKAPVLRTLLYDSPYESQFWMIFDSNKQLMASGDFRPEYKKLPKGDYVIRFQIRHDRKDLLENLQKLNLIIDQKLSKDITLNVYSTLENALLGGTKFPTKGVCVRRGQNSVFYVAQANAGELPKAVVFGDSLHGTLSLYSKSNGEGAGTTLEGLRFTYLIPPILDASSPSREDTTDGSNGGEEQDNLEAFLAAKKVEYLKGLLKQKKVAECKRLLEVTSPTLSANALYSFQLQSLDFEIAENKAKDVEVIMLLERKVAVAKEALAIIDRSALAMYYVAAQLGTKNEALVAATKQKKAAMEGQKDYFLAVLSHLLDAMLQLLNLAKEEEKAAKMEFLEVIAKDLMGWTNVEENPVYVTLYVRYLRAKGSPGDALIAIKKALSEEGCAKGSPAERELTELQLEIVGKDLSWSLWQQYLASWQLIHYPCFGYALF